jgi:hypothetical protein
LSTWEVVTSASSGAEQSASDAANGVGSLIGLWNIDSDAASKAAAMIALTTAKYVHNDVFASLPACHTWFSSTTLSRPCLASARSVSCQQCDLGIGVSLGRQRKHSPVSVSHTHCDAQARDAVATHA